MVAFYERRTREHIDRVRRCLELMAQGSPHREELLERAKVHDASKFGREERLPYVWLTEYHRCRRAGEPFSIPRVSKQKLSARFTITSRRIAIIPSITPIPTT